MNMRAYHAGAFASIGALLALLPLSAPAQNSFTYTLLPLPGFLPKYPIVKALGINALDEVVGYGGPGGGGSQERGILWDASHIPTGLFQDSYPVTSFFSQAMAINDAGTIAGQAATSSNFATSMPFLYSAGTYTLLNTLGQSGEIAALNNNNQSVGVLYPSTGYPGASTLASVYWDATGAATLINPPGGQNRAYSINDSGIVVGETNLSNLDPPNQPFLWNSMTGASLLPVGGAIGGGAHAINNGGDVAGYLETLPQHGADHAAIWHNGTPTDIHPFGLASRATGINSTGAAIGWIRLNTPDAYSYGLYHANGTTQVALAMLDETFPYNHLDVNAIGPDGSIVGYPWNINANGSQSYGPPVLLTPSQTVLPHPTEVTTQLSIQTAARVVYDPVSKLWKRNTTFTNLSNMPLPGPFDIVFTGIANNPYIAMPPGGTVLVNAPQGAAFSRFSISGNALAPGASVTLGLGFSLPALAFGSTSYSITHVYAGPGRP